MTGNVFMKPVDYWCPECSATAPQMNPHAAMVALTNQGWEQKLGCGWSEVNKMDPKPGPDGDGVREARAAAEKKAAMELDLAVAKTNEIVSAEMRLETVTGFPWGFQPQRAPIPSMETEEEASRAVAYAKSGEPWKTADKLGLRLQHSDNNIRKRGKKARDSKKNDVAKALK